MTYVMVVDDDPDISTMLTGLLEIRGYAARAVPGAEVQGACRRERPALILLDLLMPPPDGQAVYAALRADPDTGDIPVVVLTALGRLAAVVPDLTGARRLDKPFSIDELLALVAEYAGEPGRS